MAALFRDRNDAGRQLAARLVQYADNSDVRVLALPRGGVPVGFEVARALHAPLDVFLVRKLGLPGHEEFAMGAIASGGILILDESTTHRFGVSDAALARVIEAERRQLEWREQRYRGDRPLQDVAARTVIIVDDGLATGSTMRAAIAGLRQENPQKIIAAVPVGSEEICAQLRGEADEVVCLATPEPFYAVGLWYRVFDQTSDDEVRALLERSEKFALARSGHA